VARRQGSAGAGARLPKQWHLNATWPIGCGLVAFVQNGDGGLRVITRLPAGAGEAAPPGAGGV